jgi:hypothetical protein
MYVTMIAGSCSDRSVGDIEKKVRACAGRDERSEGRVGTEVEDGGMLC